MDKAKYKDLTLDELKKAFSEIVDREFKTTFNQPIGRIPGTDMYRLSDNCVTGKGGWDMFTNALKESADANTGT